MHKSIKSLLIACLVLLPGQVSAQWIEAMGEANIFNDNVAKAREEAINQALRYASLKSGATFNSRQEINHGELTRDSFSVNLDTQASNIELISEQILGNKIQVKLRLDITEDPAPQCQIAKLRAAVLIPQAQMKDRTQLRYGQLGGLEQVISERLGQTLNQFSRYSFGHVHARERLDIEPALEDVRGYRLPSWLSDITDSQYLLIPNIIDISTEPEQTRMLGLLSSPARRHFELQLSLYHGISGEQLWQQSYATTAPWEFEHQEVIAPNSGRFWSSTYAQQIVQILKNATLDIDNVLGCRPLLGQVVARQADRIIVNLGRRHGIKVGDQLQLVLQQNLPDRLNLMRPIASQSRATVTVEQVSEESATATLEGENASYNVQISDMAIKI
jgi:hypothetical protein